MVDKGAEDLILLSRSGPKMLAVRHLSRSWNRRGVAIVAASCDAGDSSQLGELVQDCADLPPIKGAINCAMVIRDSIFHNMTHNQ